MRIPFGSILGCCVAALPLIGCVGGYAPMPPQAGSPPAAAIPEQGVYTASVATGPLRASTSYCRARNGPIA